MGGPTSPTYPTTCSAEQHFGLRGYWMVPVKEHFCLGEVAGSYFLGPGMRAACCTTSMSLPGLSTAGVTSSPPWPHLPCPSPQGPWACGFPSICTALKLCKRQQRPATAHPVGPKTGKASMQGAGCLSQPWPSSNHTLLSFVPTASSLGPLHALLAFWAWSQVQEPLDGAAYGLSVLTH